MTHTNPSRRARALFKAIRKLDRKRRREADRAAFVAEHGREPTTYDRWHMLAMRDPVFRRAFERESEALWRDMLAKMPPPGELRGASRSIDDILGES